MIKKHLWTSILEYPESLDNLMDEFLKFIEDKIEFFPETKTTLIYDTVSLGPHLKWRKDSVEDHTCIAKGWFIDRFIKFTRNNLGELPEEFLINFGGDIYSLTKAEETVVNSKYHSNLRFLIRKGGCVFCSTNRERSGHIPDAVHDVSYSFSSLDPMTADKQATLGLVKSESDSDSLVLGQKYIDNTTYVASPFFCSTDIEIRDRMVLGFANYIRPDLLNPNIEGNLHKDRNLAQKIKDDNLSAIDKCSVLVFPKNTTDLGTLFEVGYAIRKGKIILRYDYMEDIYEAIVNPVVPKILSDSYVLDLNKLGSGIVLGYYYDKPLKYFLGSSRDNIMLMNNTSTDKPIELYPCYLPQILSDSVYRLNTLTSGS